MAAPNPPALGDLPEARFREMGHRMIDWIADYLSHPERVPVMARTRPGEVRAALPAAPPEAPIPLEAQFEAFREIILPGITHWNHPGFFGYFGVTGSYPGILGGLLAAALNVNAMLWKTSPAATELEELVLDWLRQGLGLPEGWFGAVMDTASVSSLVAMAAARERTGLDIRRRGMAGRAGLPALVAYASEQAHASIEKAAIVLGIGQENFRRVPTDGEFRMEPEALAALVAEDKGAGRRPFFVTATIGTTTTTSIDPVTAIAAVCAREGLWLHVDGAYGAAAGLLPEFRHVLAGAEAADSFVINPHKWRFTPVDFSAFYSRHPAAVRAAFSLVPEYLRTAEGDEVRNYMEYGIQLGRRMRALKLWMVFNSFGLEGIRARIREHIRLGQWLAAQIDAHADFERTAPTPLSVVCFRWVPAALQGRPGGEEAGAALDRLNQALLDRINADGRLFLSPSALHGRLTLRFAIGHIRSDAATVSAAWQTIQELARELEREVA